MFYMLSTSRSFVKIPLGILFSVITFIINFVQKNYQNNKSLNLWLALNVLFTILVVPELPYNHVSNPNFGTKETYKISVVFDEGLQF